MVSLIQQFLVYNKNPHKSNCELRTSRLSFGHSSIFIHNNHFCLANAEDILKIETLMQPQGYTGCPNEKYTRLNSFCEGALLSNISVSSSWYRRDLNLDFATSHVQIGSVFAEKFT